MTQIVIGICSVLLCAFYGMVFYLTAKDSQPPGEKYDERQTLARGRAFRDAFFAVMVLCVICIIITEIAGISFIGLGDALLALILTGCGVFAVRSARNGALYGFRNENEMLNTTFGGLFYPMFLTSIMMPVFRIIDGTPIRLLNESGQLDTMAILLPILFLTGAAGIYATIAYKRESAMEEPEADNNKKELQ